MGEPKAEMCYRETHTTRFYERTLPELKNMLASANPDTVDTVADNWFHIHESLVGGSDGGIKTMLDNAVREVLEHWSGAAAEAFQKRADEISRNIESGAQWAQHVGNGMKSAASSLRHYKQELDNVQMPSSSDSAWDYATDWDRDDGPTNQKLASGVPTRQVLEDEENSLSAGKEAQLRGAIVMEYLGASYRSTSKAMGEPGKGVGDWQGEGPDDSNPPMPAVIPVPPSVSSPRRQSPTAMSPSTKGPGYTSPSGVPSPRPQGISGGVSGPPKPTAPPIKTGLDGLTGGAGGLGPGGGLGSGGLGGGLGGGAGAGGGGAGAGTSGLPGMPGAMARGTARGGVGAGARGGRPGTPGMGGGAGAGAGKAGAKGAGRGGPLARQKGGIIGAAKGKTGAGAQGGSGLHRSRGGTQAGKPGGSGRGMAGAPGAHGANRDKEKERGQRPDYLVEDEETWTPERNVAPRVIE